MATFAENQEQLNKLFTAYQTALSIYNTELSQNQQGHANQQNGVWVFPYSGARTDEGSFYNWLKQSDAALVAKKSSLDAAQLAYDTFKRQIDDSTLAQYANTNPALYADILKNKDSAEANAAALLAKQNFAQKNTKYLIIGGIVIAVLLVGYFIYKKVKK